jgi:hypothetical protein
MNCRRPASIAACDILAITISVEREAGLFVIGLFSWNVPMFDGR